MRINDVRVQGYSNVKDFTLNTTNNLQGLSNDILYKSNPDDDDFDNVLKQIIIRVENAPIRIGFGNVIPDQGGNGFPVGDNEVLTLSSFNEAESLRFISSNNNDPAKLNIIALY